MIGVLFLIPATTWYLLSRPCKLCRYCGHTERQHLDGICYQPISPEFGGQIMTCGCHGFWRPE